MLRTHRQAALAHKSIFISCIIPAYNEEALIVPFLEKLQQSLHHLTSRFEIIVVDDGSRDGTYEQGMHLPAHYQLKLIKLSRNFGKEVALTAGIDYAQGEVVILIDADFQHPIEIITKFLQQWSEGYDMVYGVRQDRVSESSAKRNSARLFYWLMKKITKIDMPNNVGDFRLLDRKVVDALKQFPERSRFMKGLYAWVGFKKIGVSYAVQARPAGKSGWGFVRLTELALTGITSFSDIPLRVWGFIGFIISSISLLYALFFLTSTIIYGTDLPGFPTLVVAVIFLGGMQLLSIGILGEYIARIFTEVKHRPIYLIESKQGFDE